MKKIGLLSLAVLITALYACGGAPPAASNTASNQNIHAANLNVGPRANTGGADPANGIYVSPSGSDAGADGSRNKPFKSVNAALAAAQPGDTIILRGGVYREGVNVRVRIPNITIKSAEGEWAVIDLTVYNPGHDEDSGVYFDVDSSGGKLQSVEVAGGFYAVCTETKWDWGDPADRAGASDIIIEDCILRDSRYDVVKIKPNCNNITIRYNEIYNSGRAFDGRPKNGEDNAEGIDNVNGGGMTVHNNYIHDIVSTAVYAKGGAIDALIENNFIERAYGAGIMLGFDTSPEFFDLTANPKYYENINGIARNNIIIDTGWEGIGLYGAKDAKVYNNTLVNVANGGLYHSAIYFGLTYQDWESYAGRPASVNANIYNNIISQPDNIVRPMVEIRYSHELGGMAALEGSPVMYGNCYYIAGKRAVFADYRPGSELENAGLSEWQSHIGGDKNSFEADPGLGADFMPANPLCAGIGALPGFAAPPSLLNFRKSNKYTPGRFADVNENDWYGYNRGKTIAGAYEYNLMSGSGANAFNPAGNITVAEILTVAARVNSIYYTARAVFPAGAPWYEGYINHAIKSGIINSGDFDLTDYNRPATRAEMAYIFSRALPESELVPQNNNIIPPDVDINTPYHGAILKLYAAGIIAGSDALGTFNPNSNITRAEAATIIIRVILPETRIK